MIIALPVVRNRNTEKIVIGTQNAIIDNVISFPKHKITNHIAGGSILQLT